MRAPLRCGAPGLLRADTLEVSHNLVIMAGYAVDVSAKGRRLKKFNKFGKIPFEPFVGIGPRRFFDLFSMRLSRGYEIKRKSDGKVVEWVRSIASPRIQMLALSYLEREQIAAERVYSATDVLKKQGRLL